MPDLLETSLLHPQISLQLFCIHGQLLQLSPTLCNPTDCSPPGSSVRGILQARIQSGLLCPPPGVLPDPGIQPASLMPPVLAGGFFTIPKCLWRITMFQRFQVSPFNTGQVASTTQVEVLLKVSILGSGQ